MHAGKLVFAQLLEFAPWHTFRRLVGKYQGNFNVRRFSCLDQFLCMAFAQLTYRESLRDIEVCLRAQPEKLYHMGIRGNAEWRSAEHFMAALQSPDLKKIADTAALKDIRNYPAIYSVVRM